MSSSDFFKSSCIQKIDKRIEASQFSMVIPEHETSVLIGEGLTCMNFMRSGHFWQLGSITFLPELQKLQVGRF